MKLNRPFCRILRTLCFVFLACPQNLFSEELSVSAVREGIEFERGKLHNGRFRSYGSLRRNDPRYGIDIDGQIDVRCSFDYATQSVIYVQEWPVGASSVPPSIQLKSGIQPRTSATGSSSFSLYGFTGRDAYCFVITKFRSPHGCTFEGWGLRRQEIAYKAIWMSGGWAFRRLRISLKEALTEPAHSSNTNDVKAISRLRKSPVASVS